MTDILAKVEELRRLKAAATAGEIDTADIKESDVIQCPLCDGDGDVERKIYINYDGVAASVGFYGVGPEHGANEQYFRALHKNAVDVIDVLLLQRYELISAAKAVIPHGETPKEDTPENWAWQIRMMGEDRRAAYRQLHVMQLQRDTLHKELVKSEANASKWQSTADSYCKKMNYAIEACDQAREQRDKVADERDALKSQLTGGGHAPWLDRMALVERRKDFCVKALKSVRILLTSLGSAQNLSEHQKNRVVEELVKAEGAIAPWGFGEPKAGNDDTPADLAWLQSVGFLPWEVESGEYMIYVEKGCDHSLDGDKPWFVGLVVCSQESSAYFVNQDIKKDGTRFPLTPTRGSYRNFLSAIGIELN